jgi:hypothetical protein
VTPAQIQAQIDRLLALIAEVTANPKPSYRDADGLSVDWTQYLAQLEHQLEKWEDRLARANAGGPISFIPIKLTLGDHE